ncbi:hypothetical protein BBOR36S_00112 [Brevibacillus borstelensis]|jgi:hypothetical protein
MKRKLVSLSLALIVSLCIGIANTETSSSTTIQTVQTYTHGVGG